MLRDEEEAADLTQEVFMRAYTGLDRLRDPERIKSWLFSIAHHAALDHLRRAGRARRVLPCGDEDAGDPLASLVDTDRLADPDAAAAEAHARLVVWEVVGGLAPKHAALLDLSVRRGMTAEEIAGLLGASRGNVHVMLTRARQAFAAAAVTYLMLRDAGRDCLSLTAGGNEQHGRGFTPEVRATAERHIIACPTCSTKRRGINVLMEL